MVLGSDSDGAGEDEREEMSGLSIIMFQILLTGFLLLNAVFWGLFSHSAHCKVAAGAGIKNCPPHWMHLATGLAAFVGAMVSAQWGYLTKGHYL